MPNTYKILGQITGSNASRAIYTVPAGSQAVVSSVVFANRSTSVSFYRIAAITSGSTLADRNYLAYDIPLSGSDSIALTLGVTLNTGDRLEGYSSGSNISSSFTAFGTEIV